MFVYLWIGMFFQEKYLLEIPYHPFSLFHPSHPLFSADGQNVEKRWDSY